MAPPKATAEKKAYEMVVLGALDLVGLHSGHSCCHLLANYNISIGSYDMTSNFDRAFSSLLGNEGGYSNHPSDPGGETMWGITLTTARHAGYAGKMRDMSVEVAKEIYRERYWRPEFDRMPYMVAFQVFDAAVNSGTVVAVKWLQNAIGVKEDGIIGQVTMAAIGKRDPLETVIRFNSTRLSFLASLPSWPSFGRGWILRVANNMIKAIG